LEFLLCTLTPDVQHWAFHRNHVIWRTKITKFWRNGNDSKWPYCLITYYYIDRCELWGFFREINSGIFTCENISCFPPELLLHNYKCSGYVPGCATVNTHTLVSWKEIREMSLTTLAHNQHDVIDVICRLPVWNVNIIRYLASCTLQFWSKLTKICFQGKHFNNVCVLL
jgi:hypothetical protein